MNEVIAGFCAGIVGTVLGYPLDTIKVRQQTSGSAFLSSASSIYKENGYTGFFRGIAAPITALTILNTMNFSTYAINRKFFNVSDEKLENGKFEYRVTVAAAMVGPLSSLISTPFELLKTQMQLDLVNSKSGQRQFRSTIDAAYKLSTGFGIKSLYVGFGTNTMREIVFLGSYFTVYEHLKVRMSRLFEVSNGFSSASITVPIAGGIAGSAGWFISFPLDLIKANKQGIIITRESLNNKLSFYQVGAFVLKKRGFIGLYSGLTPSLIRAFIVSSTRFTVYESALWLLKP